MATCMQNEMLNQVFTSTTEHITIQHSFIQDSDEGWARGVQYSTGICCHFRCVVYTIDMCLHMCHSIICLSVCLSVHPSVCLSVCLCLIAYS